MSYSHLCSNLVKYQLYKLYTVKIPLMAHELGIKFYHDSLFLLACKVCLVDIIVAIAFVIIRQLAAFELAQLLQWLSLDDHVVKAGGLRLRAVEHILK